MNELQAYNYCEETIKFKHDIEKSYLGLCQRLHKIKEERLYEASFETWSVFLEELRIDRATAERMVKIYETFVIKYGISPAKIEGAGGWSVVAELLPISNSKQEAEEALEYATGALKKDVRIYVHAKRYGKESEKMCSHQDTYSVTICKECGDRWQLYKEEQALLVVEALKKLQTGGDIEAEHGNADDILVAFLRSLGYDNIADEYDKIEKWYA